MNLIIKSISYLTTKENDEMVNNIEMNVNYRKIQKKNAWTGETSRVRHFEKNIHKTQFSVKRTKMPSDASFHGKG